MLKRIKIVNSFYDHKGDDRKGEEFDALVIKNKSANMVDAIMDVGGDYSFCASNMDGQDALFEILGPIRSEKTAHLTREIKTLKDEQLKDADKLQTAYESIDKLTADLVGAKDVIVKLENAPVNRALIQDGYAIIPCAMLDDELARDVGSEPECIINARELIAMRASAVMEINKGDTRSTSLNVKLYRAIDDFANDEIHKLINEKAEQ